MSTTNFQWKGACLLLTAGCLIFAWTGSRGSRALAEGSVHAVLLNSSGLTESSGVAQIGPVIWTHNDSGDVPRLFAFAHDGSLLGQFTVRGAQAIDWEDICAFERDGKRYLAVGDIGDNSARRESVRIYVIHIPELPDLLGLGELTVQSTFEIRYPTGAVNCEALAYDPLSRSFLLATKELIYSRLYRVAAETLIGTQFTQAQFIGSLILPLVTGGDISPDGQQLVLSTYGPGCLLQRSLDGAYQGTGWQTHGKHAPHLFALPLRLQGESIGFSEDGQRLWLTSEEVPTPLFNIPVPKPWRL